MRTDVPASTCKIRRADPGDAETVQRISADAYITAYMSVLGRSRNPLQKITGLALKSARFGFWRSKASRLELLFWRKVPNIC
jgi:hypothetical protein